MNTLLKSLFVRAAIATPVANAHAYLALRGEDNLKLGDITALPYAKARRVGNKWHIAGKSDETAPRVFGTEVEARADILRRFW